MNAVSHAPVERQPQAKPVCRTLSEALAELAISPFDPQEVKRHKRQVEREHPPSPRIMRQLFSVADVAARPFALIFLVGLGITVGACVVGFVLVAVGSSFPTTVAMWSATATVVSFFLLVLISSVFSKVTLPGEWQIVRYSNYVAVPDFAAALITEIREVFPDARFLVHRFVQEEVKCPLLEVRSPAGESFFVAVWDENGFDVSKKLRRSN